MVKVHAHCPLYLNQYSMWLYKNQIIQPWTGHRMDGQISFLLPWDKLFSATKFLLTLYNKMCLDAGAKKALLSESIIRFFGWYILMRWVSCWMSSYSILVNDLYSLVIDFEFDPPWHRSVVGFEFDHLWHRCLDKNLVQWFKLLNTHIKKLILGLILHDIGHRSGSWFWVPSSMT